MSMFSANCARLRPCKKLFTIYRSYSDISSSNHRQWLNRKYRIRLAAAYRGLDSYGFSEGVSNHLSAKVPSTKSDEDIMLIIPFGLHWSEVTPSNLIGINKKGEITEGEGEVQLAALCIHQGIYNRLPDVRSIMHAHMPYATALTCLEDSQLLMIHQNSTRFFKNIAYTQYNGVGNTVEEGERLAEALENKNVLFMGNHGITTVAKSIDVAFDYMYHLERAAMVQILAYNTQRKLKEIDETVVKLTAKQLNVSQPYNARNHLNAIIQQLGKLDSSFCLSEPFHKDYQQISLL